MPTIKSTPRFQQPLLMTLIADVIIGQRVIVRSVKWLCVAVYVSFVIANAPLIVSVVSNQDFNLLRLSLHPP